MRSYLLSLVSELFSSSSSLTLTSYSLTFSLIFLFSSSSLCTNLVKWSLTLSDSVLSSSAAVDLSLLRVYSSSLLLFSIFPYFFSRVLNLSLTSSSYSSVIFNLTGYLILKLSNSSVSLLILLFSSSFSAFSLFISISFLLMSSWRKVLSSGAFLWTMGYTFWAILKSFCLIFY